MKVSGIGYQAYMHEIRVALFGDEYYIVADVLTILLRGDCVW